VSARELVAALVAARNARSPEQAARALRDDVRYWDCERGDVEGRDAVATALTAVDGPVEVETLAASGDDAVAELQIRAGGRSYRSTEVYRVAGGSIASVKAYFDPAARG
jgi:ketosteroid isomerase-like protein